MRTTAIPFRLAPAVLVALCGCPGTAATWVRFHPPTPAAGETAGTQLLRAREAVRDVASLGGLRCREPPDGNFVLLECWPRGMRPSPAFVSMHLQQVEGSYVVEVFESFGPFSRPRLLCSIEDRLAERIEVRLDGAVVERDPRGRCPTRAR